MEPHRKAALDKAIDELREHFDNVVILASYHDAEDDGSGHSTKWAAKARGNSFANCDLARFFIQLEEADRLKHNSD